MNYQVGAFYHQIRFTKVVDFFCGHNINKYNNVYRL